MEKQRGTAYFGLVKPVVVGSSPTISLLRYVAQLDRVRIHSCPRYSLHFILKIEYGDAVISVPSELL